MSNSNAASPREPPSPPSSHIAHAPEPSTARPQLPQASALTESHSTLHHQNVRPHLHFALFLAAWMIQWHFSICGRWRAGTCHSPTPIGGVPRPRRPWAATYGCCRWLLARPQSHWSTVLPDPGSVLIPRACLLLLTSSSLLAEISALLAPFACRQRARKSPIFVLILRRVFQVESVKVRSGLEIPQSHGASCPPHPQASCRPVRASEMTPVHVGTVEGRGRKKPSVSGRGRIPMWLFSFLYCNNLILATFSQ